MTSDGGGILLREIEEQFGFIKRFAACFTDYRNPESIEHPVVDLLKQRLFGLCLGYEDLNDHDWLRHDAMLAVLVGKEDPEGHDRLQRQGAAGLGPGTLGLEILTPLERPEFLEARLPGRPDP